MSEHQIQKAIIDYCAWALPADQRVFAVSNNPRSKATGGREKARGMWAGVPDIVLTGRIHGLIEVKRPGQKLRANQVGWEEFCIGSGTNHAVVRSIEDVIEVLHNWGVKLSERVHL